MNENLTATETTAFLEGDIVTILGDNRFTGRQGIVIDMASDKQPEDGPVAVYFDAEVPDHEFYQPGERSGWSGGVPNKENHRACCRVICFRPDELRRDAEFPIETLVQRKFGSNWARISSWKFPLRPGTHDCQFESCKTGQPATMLTLVNVWGTVCTVYSCESCHEKWHGVRTDGFSCQDDILTCTTSYRASRLS